MVGSRGKGDGERLAQRTCVATAGTTKRTPAGAAQPQRTARRRFTASQSPPPPPRTVAQNACEIAAWKWSWTIRQRRIVQLRKGTISERIHWPRFCLWQKEVWRWPKFYILKNIAVGDVYFLRSFLCVAFKRGVEIAWVFSEPGKAKAQAIRQVFLQYHPVKQSHKKKWRMQKFRKRTTILLHLLCMKCAPFVLAFFCCTTNLCKKS
jgi:hypothetical protein